MNKTLKLLLEELNNNNEDFELYPTTEEMIKCIWNHRRQQYSDKSGVKIKPLGDVLDIGCGTCNFKKYIDKFNLPFVKQDGNYVDKSKCVTINQYYVMEKSQILINRLPEDVIVLGTDFNTNTLIDKPVDTIFCNPPYSEYEDWMSRIIKESVSDSLYFVVPQRWKNSEKIGIALESVKAPYSRFQNGYKEKFEVLGSFDFLDAERTARAKVDIVFIDKSFTKKDTGFDSFFDEFFKMEERKSKTEYEEKKSDLEELKSELTTGKNKIEILCSGYEKAQQQLFEHFKVISSLDADILDTIGIQKEKVKLALKSKFSNLKNVYWEAAFNCLEEITSRLTSDSREKMLNRFTALKTVDFNASNVYSLIVWVMKNANKYYKNQMVDFFYALSSNKNIQNYKSNKRVFEQDDWAYRNKKLDHFTLDYRIICTKHALPGKSDYVTSFDYSEKKHMKPLFANKISDVCTVANNLGFEQGKIVFPEDYGQKGIVYMKDNKTILFEFRSHANGNVHLKFNKEFMKALNVEVARELNWIKTPEEIKEEFCDEFADEAEKYFNKTVQFKLTEVPKLILGE